MSKRIYASEREMWAAKRRRQRARYPERFRRNRLIDRIKLRDKARSILGGKCACCGEHRGSMLQIDHINNDGYLDTRSAKNYNVMQEVVRMDNPKSKYQVLCARQG